MRSARNIRRQNGEKKPLLQYISYHVKAIWRCWKLSFTIRKAFGCLDSKKYIEFELVGDGTLIQNQGTSTGSRKVQAYNGGPGIKVNLNKGKSIVAVKSEGIPTVFMEIQ